MLSATMVTNDKSSIKFVCRLVKLYGILNYEGRPWSLILTAYHVFMLIWGLFGIFLYSVQKSDNRLEMFQAISLFCAFIHLTGKVINALVKEKKIRKLLKSLEKVRLEILKNEETKIFILSADKFLIKFMIIYNTLFLSYPFVCGSINFIVDYKTEFKNPHLILPIWIPWNINEFWKYIGGWTFNIFIIISCAGYYGCLTSLQFTFAFQISGFLKALQHHLETQGSNSKSIYQQHINIIQLIKEYNSVFSGQMYLEILLSPLQPCGFGYALIKALKQNDPSAGSLVLTTLVVTTASFNICYCGQEVSNQMEKLHTSAYMNRWYEDDPKVRKDLLQMMILTNNPTVFNFKKNIYFDFVTFSSIVQGIYTYLSMLVQFMED